LELGATKIGPDRDFHIDEPKAAVREALGCFTVLARIIEKNPCAVVVSAWKG